MGIDYSAKADHYATLAARAAFAAAVATCPHDREAWDELAGRYDQRASDYGKAARVRRAA